MSTQFITLDNAPCISYPEPETAAPTHPGEAPAASLLGDTDFFKGKSISEQAREQGVGPIKDIRVFAGVIPNDEDVDGMLAEIYRLREP